MKFLVLLLFIGVPLAEIAVFIEVGERIGIAATIGLVILTAVIGVALLKRQGMAALVRAQEAVDKGELPVDSVIDGVCLLVAGAFLLTPGLITDTAGFLLMAPGLRRGLARWAFRKIRESGSFEIHTFGHGSAGPRRRGDGAGPASGKVIEGDYEEVGPGGRETDDKKGTDRDDSSSPWRNGR